ncbi:MAG: NAD(+) diphosphatase [Alphaproteobacteria bacterium]|nr:NAD(+) diphosphatase [Alphaproteobacteria bacterium]
MAHVNIFAGSALDRVGLRRTDEAWIDALLADPDSRFVPVWRTRSLITGGEPRTAVRLSRVELASVLGNGAAIAFLGLAEETAHFAIDVSHLEEPDVQALAGGAELADLWAIGAMVERGDAALLAHARALTTWHGRHRFCGTCGGPTDPRSAGHIRACRNEACGALHFPRTDPAVIMLIEHRDRCLLGRQANWPEMTYSTLAGFVEPGESLEEAVAREVHEEVGIRIRDVTYHSSQPWPFPSSIMLGFHGVAESDALTLDPGEIADARWFTRDQVRNPSGFKLPRPLSIARQLVEHWLARG